MKVRYDKEADAMYIRVQEGEYEYSEEIGDGVVIDISKEGNVMGMEILDASERFSQNSFKKILLNK
jgi:uncharacterized protein YuzE